MAVHETRVKRNSAALFAEVTPEAKAVVDEIYETLGGKQWGKKWLVMQAVLEHVRDELGDDGLPTWWPTENAQQPSLDLEGSMLKTA